MTLQEARDKNIAPWDDLVWQNDHVMVFRDRFPVTPGHMLFVPHSDESHMIHLAFSEAQLEGERLVQSGDCDGYNIGLNSGRSAGQTVMYPHVHLILRRNGDHKDPTGGVRGVIPSKANYKKDPFHNNPIVPISKFNRDINILSPIGGFGNHVRWLMLLDPQYKFLFKGLETSYKNQQGPDWPSYENYRISNWEGVPASIRNEITTLFNDIECIDTNSKLKFFQEKIYPVDRTWWNWLIYEFRYRVFLDNMIVMRHELSELENQSLPTLIIKIDPELAYKSYLKFNSNLNRHDPENFKLGTVQAIVDHNMTLTNHNRESFAIDASVLFQEELDRDFYNQTITWAGLSDQYDAARVVHRLWYTAHKRSEKEIVDAFKAVYK